MNVRSRDLAQLTVGVDHGVVSENARQDPVFPHPSINPDHIADHRELCKSDQYRIIPPQDVLGVGMAVAMVAEDVVEGEADVFGGGAGLEHGDADAVGGAVEVGADEEAEEGGVGVE